MRPEHLHQYMQEVRLWILNKNDILNKKSD